MIINLHHSRNSKFFSEFDVVAQALKKFKSIEKDIKQILKVCTETGLQDAEMLTANGFTGAEVDLEEPATADTDPTQNPQYGF